MKIHICTVNPYDVSVITVSEKGKEVLSLYGTFAVETRLQTQRFRDMGTSIAEWMAAGTNHRYDEKNGELRDVDEGSWILRVDDGGLFNLLSHLNSKKTEHYGVSPYLNTHWFGVCKAHYNGNRVGMSFVNWYEFND